WDRGRPWRPSGRSARRRRARVLLVPLLEALDAACGIDQLLAAGEEGMAARADLDAQVLPRRAGLERRAARTDHRNLVVLGMNLAFNGGTSSPGGKYRGRRRIVAARVKEPGQSPFSQAGSSDTARLRKRGLPRQPAMEFRNSSLVFVFNILSRSSSM